MGLSGVLGILTTRLIIGHFGTEAYAQYGLLTSMRDLLPFADLGVGTAVVAALAASSNVSSDDAVRRTILTAFRIVLLSTLVISTGAVALTLLGLWRPMLGDVMTAGGELPAMIVLIIFAVGIPLGLGPSILIGLGRTSRQITTQLSISPTVFLLVSLSVALSAPVGSWLAVYSYFANALASALCLWQASRLIRPQLRVIMRQLHHRQLFPGLPVMNMAWPMLIQMTILPFAMGSDRIMLSHWAGATEVVKYSLGIQLFGLILQTIYAAGITLWPIFARNRANSVVQAPWRMCIVFVCCGLIASAGMCIAAPWVVRFIANDQVILGWPLALAFSGYVLVEAAKYPLGMYMTDLRGLRFQVLPILVMVPIKIGLAYTLIPLMGAAGSVWSTVLSVGLCQVVVYTWWIRRDLACRRRPHERQRGRRALRP